MRLSKTLTAIAIAKPVKEGVRDLYMRSLTREQAHQRHNRLANKHGIAAIAQRDGSGTPTTVPDGLTKLVMRAAKAEDRRQTRDMRLAHNRQRTNSQPVQDAKPATDISATLRPGQIRGSCLEPAAT